MFYSMDLLHRFVVSCLFVLFLVPRAQALDVVSYSGMVRISDNSYLMVNDRKSPANPGSRVGVLTVTSLDGLVYHPLSISNWCDEVDREPSDLEACCSIPGRDGEYLLAESGQFKRKFGRIFHVRVDRDEDGAWRLTCLKAFKPKRPELDENGSTWEGDEIEGMTCWPGFAKDKPILVLGSRGGKVRGEHQRGQLVWGVLDLTSYEFTTCGNHTLKAVEGFTDGRDCSDLLCLEEQDNSWVAWSVATRDAGNLGPFHSAVHRVGRFRLDTQTCEIRFDAEETPTAEHHLHGLKVEALGAPPKSVANAVFAVGTDDENFGGIWRPLFIGQ